MSGNDDDIHFAQEEWQIATDLAARLLTALGPQQSGCCEQCNPPRVLSPNYAMKYELAKMFFKGRLI